MSNHVYHWEAVVQDKKDIRVIQQFDQHGQEHPFQEVRDNMDKLVFFFIRSTDNKICIGVDLVAGHMHLHGVQELVMEGQHKENIRLIYFRRCRAEVGEQGEIKGTHLWQVLGFQYIDVAGKNHKCVAQVDESGNILIEG